MSDAVMNICLISAFTPMRAGKPAYLRLNHRHSAGESAPNLRESAALSPEVEIANAARGGCGTGAQT